MTGGVPRPGVAMRLPATIAAAVWGPAGPADRGGGWRGVQSRQHQPCTAWFPCALLEELTGTGKPSVWKFVCACSLHSGPALCGQSSQVLALTRALGVAEKNRKGGSVLPGAHDRLCCMACSRRPGPLERAQQSEFENTRPGMLGRGETACGFGASEAIEASLPRSCRAC